MTLLVHHLCVSGAAERARVSLREEPSEVERGRHLRDDLRGADILRAGSNSTLKAVPT